MQLFTIQQVIVNINRPPPLQESFDRGVGGLTSYRAHKKSRNYVAANIVPVNLAPRVVTQEPVFLARSMRWRSDALKLSTIPLILASLAPY